MKLAALMMMGVVLAGCAAQPAGPRPRYVNALGQYPNPTIRSDCHGEGIRGMEELRREEQRRVGFSAAARWDSTAAWRRIYDACMVRNGYQRRLVSNPIEPSDYDQIMPWAN